MEDYSKLKAAFLKRFPHKAEAVEKMSPDEFMSKMGTAKFSPLKEQLMREYQSPETAAKPDTDNIKRAPTSLPTQPTPYNEQQKSDLERAMMGRPSLNEVQPSLTESLVKGVKDAGTNLQKGLGEMENPLGVVGDTLKKATENFPSSWDEAMYGKKKKPSKLGY